MGKHTQGPWEVVERSDTFNIKAGNRCIARLQKKAGAKDDAYFIATLESSHAELLEALRFFMAGNPVVGHTAYDKARQAIKKAEEKQ